MADAAARLCTMPKGGHKQAVQRKGDSDQERRALDDWVWGCRRSGGGGLVGAGARCEMAARMGRDGDETDEREADGRDRRG